MNEEAKENWVREILQRQQKPPDKVQRLPKRALSYANRWTRTVQSEFILVQTATPAILDEYFYEATLPSWKVEQRGNRLQPTMQAQYLPWIPYDAITLGEKLNEMPLPYSYHFRFTASAATDEAEKSRHQMSVIKNACSTLCSWLVAKGLPPAQAARAISQCRFSIIGKDILDIFWPPALPKFPSTNKDLLKPLALQASGQRCPPYFKALQFKARNDLDPQYVVDKLNREMAGKLLVVDLWQKYTVIPETTSLPPLEVATDEFRAIVLLLGTPKSTSPNEGLLPMTFETLNAKSDKVAQSTDVRRSLPGYIEFLPGERVKLLYPERELHCSRCYAPHRCRHECYVLCTICKCRAHNAPDNFGRFDDA